jgi:hypothetical protein
MRTPGATCGKPRAKTSCARSTPPERRSPSSSQEATLFQRRHTSSGQAPVPADPTALTPDRGRDFEFRSKRDSTRASPAVRRTHACRESKIRGVNQCAVIMQSTMRLALPLLAFAPTTRSRRQRQSKLSALLSGMWNRTHRRAEIMRDITMIVACKLDDASNPEWRSSLTARKRRYASATSVSVSRSTGTHCGSNARTATNRIACQAARGSVAVCRMAGIGREVVVQ